MVGSHLRSDCYIFFTTKFEWFEGEFDASISVSTMSVNSYLANILKDKTYIHPR
jgi:hypothetical protein